MNSTLKITICALLIGVLAGFLQALLGLGGGIVIIPILVLVLGMGQKEAQGATLWYIAPTAVVASALYFESKSINIYIEHVLTLIIGSFIGIIPGFIILKRIRAARLKLVFGAVLALLAVVMLFDRVVAFMPNALASTSGQVFVATFFIGIAAGFLSGLLGMGGGVIVIPAMVLICGFGQKSAQGMSLMYIIPTAFVSAILYRFKAKISISMSLIIPMIAGGIAGILAGWVVVNEIRGRNLQIIFIVAMGSVGIYYYIRAKREKAALNELPK